MQTFWYKRLLLKEAPTMLKQLEAANTAANQPEPGSAAAMAIEADAAAADAGGGGGGTPAWKKLSSLLMQLRKVRARKRGSEGARVCGHTSNQPTDPANRINPFNPMTP